MKVLMFGWEFPPYISGGLGTACLGLTTSLAKLGTEVKFVMPKVTGDRSTALADFTVHLIDVCQIKIGEDVV